MIEYSIYSHASPQTPHVTKLQEYGDKGWELVVVKGSDYIFKRKKKPWWKFW